MNMVGSISAALALSEMDLIKRVGSSVGVAMGVASLECGDSSCTVVEVEENDSLEEEKPEKTDWADDSEGIVSREEQESSE